MDVSTINNWEDVLSLRDDWQRLHGEALQPSIFCSFPWMATWHDVTAGRLEPYVLVARDDTGTVRGILPFWRVTMRFMKVVPWRVLRYMADTQTGAEYPEVICAMPDAEQVTMVFMRSLAERQDEWDLVFLPRMATWTGTLDRFTRSLGDAGLQCHRRMRDFSYAVLPQSLAELESRFSASHRQQVRRNSRKIMRTEGVVLSACHHSTEIEECTQALFDLHHQHWSTRGDPGAFIRRPAMAAFYREFIPRAAAEGWLALYCLKLEGRPVAVQVGYVFGGDYCQMQEGYDPGFKKGAGNALRHHMIGDLIDQGLTGYDFLGDHNEHKRRWGAEMREGADLLVVSPNARTLPQRFKAIWPSGRYVTDPSEAVVTAAAQAEE